MTSIDSDSNANFDEQFSKSDMSTSMTVTDHGYHNLNLTNIRWNGIGIILPHVEKHNKLWLDLIYKTVYMF